MFWKNWFMMNKIQNIFVWKVAVLVNKLACKLSVRVWRLKACVRLSFIGLKCSRMILYHALFSAFSTCSRVLIEIAEAAIIFSEPGFILLVYSKHRLFCHSRKSSRVRLEILDFKYLVDISSESLVNFSSVQ